MASDGGIEVSRSAIERARADLQKALDLLAPGADPARVQAVAFPTDKPVYSLTTDFMAFGMWSSAQSVRDSFGNSARAVGLTYTMVGQSVADTITLLTVALGNLDISEGKGPEHLGGIQA